MVAVRDLAASATKWRSNAQNAASEYGERAAESGQRWQTNTVAAQQTYQQAISQAGVPQRYARGVQRAGAEKYARRIRDVGQSRFSEGVAVAEGDWQSGFQPFAAALNALTLSARRPRGDRANFRRVEEVGVRLNAVRLAQLGATA